MSTETYEERGRAAAVQYAEGHGLPHPYDLHQADVAVLRRLLREFATHYPDGARQVIKDLVAEEALIKAWEEAQGEDWDDAYDICLAAIDEAGLKTELRTARKRMEATQPRYGLADALLALIVADLATGLPGTEKACKALKAISAQVVPA